MNPEKYRLRRRARYLADPAKNAENTRRWREKNAQRDSEMRRARYAANPERELENNRKWARANQERERELDRAWRARNQDWVRDRNRRRFAEWRARDPEGYAAWVKARNQKYRALNAEHRRRRRARQMGAEGSHTIGEVRALFAAQGGTCAHCETNLRADAHLDHKIPLCRGGSEYIDNLQWLCPTCNLRKGRLTMTEFQRREALTAAAA